MKESIGERNWVFSGILKGTNIELKLAHFENTKIVRHIKVRSIANPYDSDWQEYFKERQERKQKRKNSLSSPKCSVIKKKSSEGKTLMKTIYTLNKSGLTDSLKTYNEFGNMTSFSSYTYEYKN